MTDNHNEVVRCAREHLAERRKELVPDPKTDLTDEEKAQLNAMSQAELEFWVLILEGVIKSFGPADNKDDVVKTRKIYHHLLVRIGVISLVARCGEKQ